MARPIKKSKMYSIRIDTKIAERLDRMALATKLTKTAIIENALVMYLEHWEKTKKVT